MELYYTSAMQFYNVSNNMDKINFAHKNMQECSIICLKSIFQQSKSYIYYGTKPTVATANFTNCNIVSSQYFRSDI